MGASLRSRQQNDERVRRGVKIKGKERSSLLRHPHKPRPRVTIGRRPLSEYRLAYANDVGILRDRLLEIARHPDRESITAGSTAFA